MLDIKEELKKYQKLQPAFSGQNELTAALDQFAHEVKRFGKEQFSTTSQLEEIVCQLEEQAAESKKQQSLSQELAQASSRLEKLLESLVASSDCFEIFYRFAQKNADQSWQKQLAMQWKSMAQILLSCGLVRIEGEGEQFLPQSQAAVGVASDLALPEGTVLDVIKSGFIYHEKVLRKAEVVVNKHQPESPRLRSGDFLD